MRRLQRHDATTFIAVTHEQLHALGGTVAQGHQRRTGQLTEGKGVRCGSAHRDQLEAKTEAPSCIATNQPMLLQRNSETMGGGARQTGGSLQFGEPEGTVCT